MNGILSLFLIIPLAVTAQSAQTDSLIQKAIDKIRELDDRAWEHINADPHQSIIIAKEALVLTRSGNYAKEEGTLLNTLGVAYGNTSDFQNALLYYDSAIKIRRRINDEPGIASTLVNMSTIYFNQGLYDKSLACNLEGLKVYEKIGNKKNAATVTINIGNIYENNGDYELAKRYYENALTLSREASYTLGESDAFIGMGNIFNYQKEYNLALINYRKSLSLKILTDDKIGMSRCFNNIGNVYKNLQHYDSALYYFKKDEELSEALDSDHLLIYPYINIADILSLKQNYSEAKLFYSKAIELSHSLNARDLTKDVYQKMSNMYYQMGNYKKAHELLRISMELKDSIFNEIKSKQLAELQTQYESEKKENEIKLLNQSNDLQKAELNRVMLIRNFFIGGFIFILIITILLYRIIRQRNTANKLLQDQKQQYQELNALKDKLFSVISHDLRSPLTSIHGFLQVMGQKKDPDQLATFISNANSTVTNTIQLLDNLLYWSASQVKGITPQFTEVNVYDEIVDILELFNVTIQSKQLLVENAVNPDEMACADVSCVRVILRNLISNAIKFSYSGGTIRIGAVHKNDMVEFSVTDSGVGIHEEDLNLLFTGRKPSTKGTGKEKGVGLGLFLCKEFIGKNGGEIKAESELGKGTIFRFTLQRYSAAIHH